MQNHKVAHCTIDLRFGFNQLSLSFDNFNITKQLNPTGGQMYSDPGFKSQAQHLCFYSQKLYLLYLSLYREKDENKQKEAGFGPYFKYGNILFVSAKKSFAVFWSRFQDLSSPPRLCFKLKIVRHGDLVATVYHDDDDGEF